MSSDALEYHGEEDLFRTPEFKPANSKCRTSRRNSWAALRTTAGQTWWDACAGEGGKMLHFRPDAEQRINLGE